MLRWILRGLWLALALLATPAFASGGGIKPNDVIVKVECIGPDGGSSGSAFKIGDGLAITATHVITGGTCFIGGRRVTVMYREPGADLAVLDGVAGPGIKIDCGGFVAGRKYTAIGYARGKPFLSYVDLEGTGEFSDTSGHAVLTGIFVAVPGQSGGPVIDNETGAAVGTVNAQNHEHGLSWSSPLGATKLCEGIPKK